MPVQTETRCQLKIRNALIFSLFRIIPISLVLTTSSCEAKDPANTALFSRSKLLTLVNKARQSGQKCGSKWYEPVGKLKWDDQLEEAAKQHSVDMFENNFFSHKGSNGMFVDDRLYTEHYFWKACGENVAYGALYEDEVMKEWLKSAGHCANIMNPAFTEMGAWITGLYWTQVFAKPQDGSPRDIKFAR
jgi:uncharacterized protein YkwD